MRVPSPSPVEPRHRLSASASDDANKRRPLRNKVGKDVEKSLLAPAPERSLNCKPTLTFVLAVIIVGTFVTLLFSPVVHLVDHQSSSESRLTSQDRLTGESAAADLRYVSSLDIDWYGISDVVEKLSDVRDYQGVGLLNFNDDEIDHWKELLPDVEHIVLHLNHASNNITWDSLYPEWIDEEEDFEVPTCPSLPEVKIPGKPRVDLVAVKLPCNNSGSWKRDVVRLHLQLEAARLAASSKGYHQVHVLLVTDCFPIPNLFTGKELVIRKGNAWLFDPNLNTLRDKLQLPVGSCELAVPLKAKGPTGSAMSMIVAA